MSATDWSATSPPLFDGGTPLVRMLRRERDKARELAERRLWRLRRVAHECMLLAMEPGRMALPGPHTDGLTRAARHVLWVLENGGRFSKHPNWSMIHESPHFMARPLEILAAFERMTGPVKFVRFEADQW